MHRGTPQIELAPGVAVATRGKKKKKTPADEFHVYAIFFKFCNFKIFFKRWNKKEAGSFKLTYIQMYRVRRMYISYCTL